MAHWHSYFALTSVFPVAAVELVVSTEEYVLFVSEANVVQGPDAVLEAVEAVVFVAFCASCFPPWACMQLFKQCKKVLIV